MARSRSALLASSAALAAVVAALPGAATGQPAADGITVIAPGGRERIGTVDHAGREMVALDDVARLFGLGLDEDSRAGTLSVTAGDAVIILTPDQQIISVAGRLVSLRAPPRRVRGRWLVPPDFLTRALAGVHGQPLEYRAQSGLLIVGGLRVPQVAARYRPGGGSGELRLDVTPSTPHSVEERGGRLVVTFAADDLDLVRQPRLDGELATGFGRVANAPSLALDLGPAVDSYSVATDPAPGGGDTLRIGLRAARAAAAAPVPAPNAPSGPASVDPLPVDPLPDFATGSALRVVVVDPGHGGDDAGSRGPDGALEKDITLGVAQRLRAVLESRLGLRVILTRERDATVDLDARAAIANNNGADLFISLHANASARPAAAGAEVFYLGIDEYGAEAQALAESEVQPIPVVGGGSRRIDPVLWEMAQILYVDRSALLAGIVDAELRRRVVMSPRPVQQAPFRVLVGANMPAVLVELGSLADPENELRLTSAPFRNAVAEALLAGIQRFGVELERRELERVELERGALEGGEPAGVLPGG